MSQSEPAARRRGALSAAALILVDALEYLGEDPLVSLPVPARLNARQQPIDTALT
jgi:hypothetical protein